MHARGNAWTWLSIALLAASGCTSEPAAPPQDDAVAAAVGTVAETTHRLEDSTRGAAASADRAARPPDDSAADGGAEAAADERPRLPAPLDQPAFRVVGVELGKSVDGANAVPEATQSFGPRDTIYASIATEGVAPSVKLDARWTTAEAELVAEDSQTFSPKGPSRAEFHVAHPRGWPTGHYRVEIGVDGSVVETREFEVRAAQPPPAS